MQVKLSTTTTISILKLFKFRENLNKYFPLVNKKRFNTEAKQIIKLFKNYFEDNENAVEIEPKLFVIWADTNGKFSNSDERYNTLEYLEDFEDLSNEEENIIVKRLSDDLRAEEIKNVIDGFNKGDITNLKEAIKIQADLFDTIYLEGEVDKVTTSVNELFKKDIDKTGVRWSLSCLNNSMTPLQAGDFGTIAARPDSGKTSFIANEVVHMASQVDQPILWLNNEGMNDKIKQRCVQSALNKTVPEIIKMIEDNEDIDELYRQKTCGGDDKIQIVGVHNKSSVYIEHLIEVVKPAIIIFDMIDNVRFIGQGVNNALRTDQILETMYQWARNLGVTHKCIVLATSQVSSPGEGMKFPTKDMLKDSKTGKQGACDFILMIGRENDNSNARYISLPKNKLAVAGQPIDPKAKVYFDYSRCQYHTTNPDVIDFTHLDALDEIDF